MPAFRASLGCRPGAVRSGIKQELYTLIESEARDYQAAVEVWTSQRVEVANDHRISTGGSVSRNSTTTSDRGMPFSSMTLKTSSSVSPTVSRPSNPTATHRSGYFRSVQRVPRSCEYRVGETRPGRRSGCEPLPSPRSWRRPDRSIRYWDSWVATCQCPQNLARWSLSESLARGSSPSRLKVSSI